MPASLTFVATLPVTRVVKSFTPRLSFLRLDPTLKVFPLMNPIFPLLSGVARKRYVKRPVLETRRLLGEPVNVATGGGRSDGGSGSGGGDPVTVILTVAGGELPEPSLA